MSNFGEAPRNVAIALQNLALPQPVQAETLAVDATHESASLGATPLASDQPTLTLHLPGNAAYLVRRGPPAAK